jgi:hypothetical protein
MGEPSDAIDASRTAEAKLRALHEHVSGLEPTTQSSRSSMRMRDALAGQL